MAFDAKNELLKHGWKEGRGLGKKEDGIKEMIKVNIKNSRSGVGHDIGEEFSYHWWDHVFNQAANNITVTNAENGVKFDVSDNQVKVDCRKRHSSAHAKKDKLYKNFIKTATLTHDSDAVREVAVEQTDTHCRVNTTPMTMTLDTDLLNRCSGLTGHRAARHGHQLSGKLSRLAQQEALHLSTQTITSTGASQRKHCKKKIKKTKLKRSATENS